MDPGGGSVTNSSGSNGGGPTANVNFPGAHPSSEGKRRRNRSNVEAMTAKHLQDDENKDDLNNHGKKNLMISNISLGIIGSLMQKKMS